MEEAFGKVEERDGKLVASFGGLKEIAVWPSKKALAGHEDGPDRGERCRRVDNQGVQYFSGEGHRVHCEGAREARPEEGERRQAMTRWWAVTFIY